jgi:hypothetical protein
LAFGFPGFPCVFLWWVLRFLRKGNETLELLKAGQQMTYKKMVRGLVAVALVTFLSTEVRATTPVIGDIVNGGYIYSGYGVGIGVNNAMAEGFTMTQSASLASVSLYLDLFSTTGPGSNLALSIYSDNSGNPGTDLYDLSTNVTGTTSGSPALATFSGTGSFTLSAGTSYWLDLYATNPASSTGTSVQWDGTLDSGFNYVNPAGPDATDIGQLRSLFAGNPPTGTPSTTDLRPAFQLNAVPEPAALTLLSTALLALGAVYLRRRGPKLTAA